MNGISQLKSGIVLVEPSAAPSKPPKKTMQERFAEFPEEALNELYYAMMTAWKDDCFKAVVVQSHVVHARESLSEHGIEVEVLC